MGTKFPHTDQPVQVRTVLIRHDAPDGVHFDWMIEDPAESQGRLWTARVPIPADQWHDVGRWRIEPIGRHRRVYLTYEGPLTDGRGTLTRVDQGVCRVVEWSDDGIVIDVQMSAFEGVVEVAKAHDGQWWATERER